jgi:hypothetical protein
MNKMEENIRKYSIIFALICGVIVLILNVLNEKTINDVSREVIPIAISGRIHSIREGSGLTTIDIENNRESYFFCISRPTGGPDFSELAEEGDSIRKASNVDSLFLYKNGTWIGWKIY